MLEKKAERSIHPTDNVDQLIFLGLDFTNLDHQFSTNTENDWFFSFNSLPFHGIKSWCCISTWRISLLDWISSCMWCCFAAWPPESSKGLLNVSLRVFSCLEIRHHLFQVEKNSFGLLTKCLWKTFFKGTCPDFVNNPGSSTQSEKIPPTPPSMTWNWALSF